MRNIVLKNSRRLTVQAPKQITQIFILFAMLIPAPIVAQEITQDINVLKFSQKSSYYTLPLSYSLGLEMRKNDFSLFAPFAELSFDVSPLPKFDSNVGAKIRYKNLYSEAVFDYELFSVGTNPFSKDTEYGGLLRIGGILGETNACLSGKVGNKRWENLQNETHGFFTVQGIFDIDCFLARTSFFQATASGNVSVNFVPFEKFASCDFTVLLPLQFNWYYGETCFLYSGVYAGSLDVFDFEKDKFVTQKKFSEITGRVPLKTNSQRYKMIHLLELEQRFYVPRFFDAMSNFFVSLFVSGGICVSEKNSVDLKGDVGIGVGYNLFGVVPFIFQIGVNDEKSLVMYFGVVAKICHKP